MGVVETIVDVVTDNRTYYNCPNCGRRVWAYGSYVGNVCLDCPGTLAHAIVKTTDLATMGMTSTIIDCIADNRTEYLCPRCGCKKWAYGVGIGRTCLNCHLKHPFGFNFFDMTNASEKEVQLVNFLNNYYDQSGKVVNINGKTFTNVVPRSNLVNCQYYDNFDEYYVCGLHAINMCLKIWNYDRQLSLYNYKVNSLLGIKYGEHFDEFYDDNIYPYFNYCDWSGEKYYLHQNIETNWSYIDDTDYTNYTLIILGGQDFAGHFQIVIGVDTEKRHYLIIDQQLKVWLVDVPFFEMISKYKFTKAAGVYTEHSVYKTG